MKIEKYKWNDILGKYPDYSCNDEEGSKSLKWYIPLPSISTPLPKIDKWIAPTLELYRKTSKQNHEIPDCINSALNEFVSEHARSVLQEIFTKCKVRLYPVNVKGASQMYYMVVPAIYEEGKHMDIFALEEASPCEKFVTKKFIDAVESNGLTGFCFEGPVGEAFYLNKNLTNKKVKVTDKKTTSFPKPKEWLKKVEKHYSKQEWFELESLNSSIMQELVNTDSIGSMMSFYDEALKLTATEKQYLRVKPSDMLAFNQKLSDAFLKAKKMAQNDETIKSIYCEYFYDGGDSCELNLFLSEEHPDEDESWASYFGEDGFIEGPGVTEFLNYDPEINFKPVLEVAASQFIQAHFIRSCIDIIKEMKIDNIPVGFAEHDGMIVLLRK